MGPAVRNNFADTAIENKTIAIAIDFGTTYSGVAYTRIDGNTQPAQLGNWPGQPKGAIRYKVPTVIAYSEDGPKLWGFEAERSTQIPDTNYLTLRLFKLFLDPTFSDQCFTPPRLSLNDLVHFYIDSLYTHLMIFLVEQGFSREGDFFNFLLTVPATFGHSTIDNYQRIVQDTGIGAHEFSVSLTEPEAAALYIIKPIQTKTNSYRIDDCFIVCDAGGGTVDLSSYAITQLDPIVRVKQTGAISGAFCGSTLIDKKFNDYLESQIESTAWQELTPAEKEFMTEEFIRRKELFGNDPYDTTFNIRLARDDILCKGKKNGHLPITREKMQEFFAGPVEKIKTMVEMHIKGCISKGYQVGFIFLVGGFGTSPYLKQQIEEHVRLIDRSIQVIKPVDAQQAVVRGALLYQMQSLKNEVDAIQSRICRAHYGLVKAKPFNSQIHLEDEKFTHPVTGEVFARNQIEWLVHKGIQIEVDKPMCFEHDITREFKARKDIWREYLVQCSSDTPPIRLGPGVDHICILTLDPTKFQEVEFEKKKKGRKGLRGYLPFMSTKYYQARYTIKITIGAIGLRPEIVYKGKAQSDLMSFSWDTLDRQKYYDLGS